MQPQQVLLGPFFDQRLDKGATIFINWTPAQILILKSNLTDSRRDSGNSVDDPLWVCDDSPKNVEKNHHTVYLILLGIISNIQMNLHYNLFDYRFLFL
jgi:hypothetical protein